MARAFVRASSHKAVHAATALSGVPLTLACWFNSDDATVSQALVSMAVIGDNDNYFMIYAAGNVLGDPLRAECGSATASGAASTSSGYTVDTWHHAVGVFTTTTSRAAYIDGANSGSDTAAVTPASLDRTAVGALERLTPGLFLSGQVAEAAIWSAALDAAEITALAKGFCPKLIRPQSLVAYWPLFGNDSPELDRWKNRFDLTLTGPPTKSDHIRIYYPD